MLKLAHRIISLQRHAPRFLLSTDNWQGDNKTDKKQPKTTKSNPQEKPLQKKQKSTNAETEQTKKQQVKNKQQSVGKKVQKQQKQQKYRDSQYDDDEQPQYQKQNRRTIGWTVYRILFWGSAALLAYNTYLVSIHDKKTPVENQSGAIPGFINGAKILYQYYDQLSEFFTKPPLDKLLPDVVHPQIQPKTLVLNVRGTLLDTQYIFGKGLTVNNRPGLQQFLKKMSQIYEVVIFSDDDSMLLNTLISSLDPRRQIITGYFGNQCMVFSRGKYIKDLKYLNRDLRKVIVIDKNKSVVQKHKENVIVLSEYKGDDKDRELVQLTSLLQSLAKPEIGDVRKTIQEMGDNPVKWYEQNLKQKQQKIKGTQKSKLFGFFSSKKN